MPLNSGGRSVKACSRGSSRISNDRVRHRRICAKRSEVVIRYADAVYREILKPEFDRLCTGTDGMVTKSDMRDCFDKIHARFDRLEAIMKGETPI